MAALGTVLSVERCSLHDGPGLRTTVFLKGCPLQCRWCHNPESQAFDPELYYFDEKCTRCGQCAEVCGKSCHAVSETAHAIDRSQCNACGACAAACMQNALAIKGLPMSVDTVLAIVLKDRAFYQKSGGGLTISGGEPLAQFAFTQALLQQAKANGIHTCVETSGHAPKERLSAIVPYVDICLYDFKASDEQMHRRFTGVSRGLIAENLLAIDALGQKTILRCPIIPTFNDNAAHFTAIADTANTLKNICEINLMPYHPMGASKASRIGKDYPMPDIGFPDDSQVASWLDAVSRQTAVPVKRG